MGKSWERGTVFQNWHIKRTIGAGSYGKVYEIERVEADAVYRSALKVISIPQNESEIKSRLIEGENYASVTAYYQGVARSLLNENRVMAELRGNSNIVSYEDHQVIQHENGVGCDILIRMELLTSFMDYMAKNRIDEQTVVRLGIDICKALEICNRKSIIHRDIKPGNIFVSDTGDFKLGDFGIARTIDQTNSELSKKGTYRYMAPEVYKGEPYGKTVDICSLGLVMYYLMNGNRTPFLPDPPQVISYQDEESALIRRMRGEQIPPPRNASPALSAIILKACAFNEKDRYASAEEMKRDLEALKNGTYRGAMAREIDATVIDQKASPKILHSQRTGTGNHDANPLRSLSGNAPRRQIPREASSESSTSNHYGNRSGSSKKKTAIIIGAVICGVLILVLVIALGLSGRTHKQLEASEETEIVKNSTESSLAVEENGIIETDADNIEILDSDWDWDSAYKDSSSGQYHVDGILYVRNNSYSPIIGIDFTAQYKDGSDIENNKTSDLVIPADGYIDAGGKGVMVSDVWVTKTEYKDKQQPDKDSFRVESAYTNNALSGYDIPTGNIVDQYGPGGDYYDIMLDNPNEKEVSQSAKLVAVKIEGNELKEADATGRLGTAIPGETYGFLREKAFDDPNFYVSYEELTVYAIDKECYKNAR